MDKLQDQFIVANFDKVLCSTIRNIRGSKKCPKFIYNRSKNIMGLGMIWQGIGGKNIIIFYW